MNKIKLIVSYDGTDFSGFQTQPGKRTIQETLERVLTKVTGEPIQIHGSGRTDAGVHASAQVCHYTSSSLIPVEKLPTILLHRLPQDILVRSAEMVSMEFHARKSACWKRYRYRINTESLPDLFTRRYQTHLPSLLDVDAMQRGARLLVGTHDFTSFCSAKTHVQDRVRTIYSCKVLSKSKSVVEIDVVGNGFLYNMVRIIAGTLYEIGRQRIAPEQITPMLKRGERSLAGPTLAPEGLCLWEVGYQPFTRKA